MEPCIIETQTKKQPRIHWMWDGVEWGWFVPPEYPSMASYSYYFYWWNWLPKESRYFGPQHMYYDGWHWSFGLWFCNISWCTALSYRFMTPKD
jgi:hypothetical protein